MEDFPVFTKKEWNLMLQCCDMLLCHQKECKRCFDVALDLYGFMSDLLKEEVNKL